MTTEELAEIQRMIGYKPDHTIHLVVDGDYVNITVEFSRPDVNTQVPGVGHIDRTVPLAMTRDQMVKSIFALLLALEEHEAREWFEFGGVRVFDPHVPLEALVKAVRTPR